MVEVELAKGMGHYIGDGVESSSFAVPFLPRASLKESSSKFRIEVVEKFHGSSGGWIKKCGPISGN